MKHLRTNRSYCLRLRCVLVKEDWARIGNVRGVWEHDVSKQGRHGSSKRATTFPFVGLKGQKVCWRHNKLEVQVASDLLRMTR